MMRGTKRVSGSDSNDSLGKRVFAGLQGDSSKPKSSPMQLQQVSTLPFDMKRAELSRQHVRALNTQFASWVQSQLQNHPDELWQDGAQDYLNHASNIMDKFSDVVNWLKANFANGETGLISGSEKKSIETDINKSGTVVTSSTGTTGSLWGFGGQNNVQSNSKGVDPTYSDTPGNALGGVTSIVDNNKSGGALPSSTGIFGGSWGSENKQIGNNLSPDNSNNTPARTTPIFGGSGGPNGSESKQIGNNLSSEKANNIPATTIASFGGTAPSFGGSWSSGTSSNNNSPFSFGLQSSVASVQNSMPIANSAANEEEEGEDAAEQPGSPSVKKTEEKGVIVVHQVKCKLYVKSTDPASAWKDRGTGQLSIKCNEGAAKGTKESKPTIIVRNDVGKVLLNALLYPGIKTNVQKNAVVAIFHSSGDGDDIDNIVARTFLLRTKNLEDRDNLAAAIKEHAPSA